MNVQALIKKTKDRLQEDALDGMIILGWFDEAQNRFALKAGAKFPSFLNPDGTQSSITEPVFDSRYHELLVVFACARYRESDEAIGEAQFLDDKFERLLDEFSTHIVVEPQYKDDTYSQLFSAVADQLSYVITKSNYRDLYSNLQVYVNGVLKTEKYDYTVKGNVVTFTIVPDEGSIISCLWQPSEIYNDKPILWGDW